MIILLYRHDIIITEFLTSILTLFTIQKSSPIKQKLGRRGVSLVPSAEQGEGRRSA